MKKSMAFIALAVILGIGGFLGYSKHSERKYIESLTPHVKNASLRLANALAHETEDTKITYKEVFEKIENHVSEIDKRLLDVQTIAIPAYKDKTDVVIAYMKSGQDLLRTQLYKYRKQLAVSSALEWSSKMIAAYGESNYYGRDFARKSADEAIKRVAEADTELKEANTAFFMSMKKMAEARATLSSFMAMDQLVDSTVLQKAIDRETTRVAEEIKATARPAPEPRSESKATVRPNPEGAAEARPAADEYVVQLGAFSNPTNVKQLRERLSANGIKSYTEVMKTDKGEKTRVRAGPFPTREAAEKANDKLKKIGLNGIVAPR